jgi:Ser/Thr protein kinase RdoA (MazF antagonist)
VQGGTGGWRSVTADVRTWRRHTWAPTCRATIAIAGGILARVLAAADPEPFVTHDVICGQDTVTKRFQRWARAESQREWQALNLLCQHAPGLAPEPISADLQACRPVIVMSRLPGRSLASGPITAAELDALAEAVRRLHRAIPASVLAGTEAGVSLRKVEDRTLSMAAACDREKLAPEVRDAYDAAVSWLDQEWPVRLPRGVAAPVFAQGDGNLANFLWDGHSVRIVDFEDAGKGDRAQELADFVEHLGVWNRGGVDADLFLSKFDLSPAEVQRVTSLRPLFAAFWLMMLMPGGPAHHRNPPGTLDRQAERVQRLLHR